MIRILYTDPIPAYFPSPHFVTLVRMQSHNKSAIDESSSKIAVKGQAQMQWPVTFPKIKSSYKRVEPAVNEPIILRYNAKALFNTDCENLTYDQYSALGQAPAHQSSARLRKTKQQPGERATQASNSEKGGRGQTSKQDLLKEGRSRLFSKFPEIKTVFRRREQPVNYLRRSMEYDF